MRVHKLTFAVLAVAAGLSLTACQNDADSASGARTDPSAAASSVSASTGGSGSGGSGGSDRSAGQGTATGSGSGGQAATGSRSGGSGQAGRCRTDGLEISAQDSTISDDPEGTVAVELKNDSGRDCTLAAYAGVDLKTNAGTVSAERTGKATGPMVLKNGERVYFGVTYPLNRTGGTGVRITGLVVTPPNETRSVTLNWPGARSLPVTDGTGSPVKVGPMGSAGQGG